MKQFKNEFKFVPNIWNEYYEVNERYMILVLNGNHSDNCLWKRRHSFEHHWNIEKQTIIAKIIKDCFRNSNNNNYIFV
ncbi:MAG: hypothetical protein Ta2E_10070 [Mycoplasmoidaceae bacterium]|nr:MAG: hypothetical protein Ta2E_10070 [Mycoplasmoidaceae bacterium]